MSEGVGCALVLVWFVVCALSRWGGGEKQAFTAIMICGVLAILLTSQVCNAIRDVGKKIGMLK